MYQYTGCFPSTFRAPELLFQPSMIGIDQSGIVDTMDFVLKKFTPDEQQRMMQVGRILIWLTMCRCYNNAHMFCKTTQGLITMHTCFVWPLVGLITVHACFVRPLVLWQCYKSLSYLTQNTSKVCHGSSAGIVLDPCQTQKSLVPIHGTHVHGSYPRDSCPDKTYTYIY